MLSKNVNVPQRLRPWHVAWAGYRPALVTPPELLSGAGLDASVAEGWAESAPSPACVDWPARQDTALIPFDVVNGLPRNPHGRTGATGRRLGWWGENAAADPIVTAGWGTRRRVLLIRRADCGQWAIPGGMVDPGETAPQALVRELHEETGVNLAGAPCTVLDRRYVDDPRNTDEAWVCTTVAHYRLDVTVPARAGSDAVDACWWPFHTVDNLQASIAAAGGRLYAAHLPLLHLIDHR